MKRKEKKALLPTQRTKTTLKLATRIANFTKTVNYYQSKVVSPAKRSPIRTFSYASYRRLKNLVLSLETPPTLFITLTYPSDFPSARASKKHLDVFAKAFLRRFPNASGIWKLEPQKRKAPHYHILITGIHLNSGSEFNNFIGFVSLTWYRIVGSHDIKHLRAGTQVINLEYNTPKKTADILSIYLTKYFSKSVSVAGSEVWNLPGRFWGVFGRKNLKLSIHCFEIDLKLFYKYRRVFRKRLKKYLLKRYGKVSKRLYSGNYSIVFSSLTDFYNLLSRLADLFGYNLVYKCSSSSSFSGFS